MSFLISPRISSSEVVNFTGAFTGAFSLNTPGSICKRFKMKFKKSGFTVLVEQDKGGMYIATVPDISGCYTQGKTLEQAMERVEEAIQVCLEAE